MRTFGRSTRAGCPLELIKLSLPYGNVGSAGDVRARELARNECPEKLKGKVDRTEGRDIGLDKRFTHFRYKQQPTQADHMKVAMDAVAAFRRRIK